MEALTDSQLIDTLWYDDYNYDGEQQDSQIRKTARIARLVEVVDDEHVRLKIIGGRYATGRYNVKRNSMGKISTVKRRRLNRAACWRPLPSDFPLSKIPNYKDD